MAPLDGIDARADGLSNVLTGLGIEDTDTRLHVERTRNGPLSGPKTAGHWCGEYQQSWTAQREVDQLPWDMFREGFTFVDVDESFPLADVQKIVNGSLEPGQTVGGSDFRRGYLQIGRQLRVAGDKVGGAVLIPIIDDGMDPMEPLDLSRIRSIDGWEVLDRREISPWSTSTTLRPEFYIIGQINEAGLAPGQLIHASRLFVHPGKELSGPEMRIRGWWGASVLELLQRERRGDEESLEYQRSFMQRCSYDHMSVAGLAELLGKKDEDGVPVGEAMVQQRLKVLSRFMTMFGILLTDAGTTATDTRGQVSKGGRPSDRVESMARTTGELVPLGEAQHTSWQRGTKMPKSIADGETPAGLHSGENAGDWQAWSGVVHAEQEAWGTPLMRWMLTILFSSKTGPTNGRVPTYGIKWNPLLIPTPLESAQIRTERAKGDAIYHDTGSLLPIEIRQARFVDGSTGEITLDDAGFGDDDATGTGPTDDLALAAAGDDVQRQALNGAQIKALFELSANVAAGALPETTALWLITVAIPGIDEAGARAALRAAASFTPATVEAALPTVALDSAMSEAAIVDIRDMIEGGRLDAVGAVDRFLDAFAMVA